MKTLLLRLRAARAPQALLALALVFLLLSMGLSNRADARSDLEKRTEKVLSAIAGAGSVQVVIRTERIQQKGERLIGNEEFAEVPCGAVAVAAGASNPLVCLQLQDALCALLDLPVTAVSIAAGGE